MPFYVFIYLITNIRLLVCLLPYGINIHNCRSNWYCSLYLHCPNCYGCHVDTACPLSSSIVSLKLTWDQRITMVVSPFFSTGPFWRPAHFLSPHLIDRRPLLVPPGPTAGYVGQHATSNMTHALTGGKTYVRRCKICPGNSHKLTIVRAHVFVTTRSHPLKDRCDGNRWSRHPAAQAADFHPMLSSTNPMRYPEALSVRQELQICEARELRVCVVMEFVTSWELGIGVWEVEP